jgi:hypothetical protein
MASPLNVPTSIILAASKESAPRKPGRKKSNDFDSEYFDHGNKKLSDSSLSSSSRRVYRRESIESAITISVGDFDKYSQLSIDLGSDTCTSNSETDARHGSFAPDCSFRLPTLDESCSTFPQGYSMAKIDVTAGFAEHDKQGLSTYRSEFPLNEEPMGASASTFSPDYSSSDLVFGESRRALLSGLGGSAKFSRDQQSFLNDDTQGNMR